jgi:phage baseplate assembly protein gpV
MRSLLSSAPCRVLVPRCTVAGLVCSFALSSWLAAPLAAQSAASRLNTTTTLAAETANNTSAANSFSAQGNGNGAAGNVSKAPTRQLLYAGSTTKILASWLPWFGGSNHMNVGYRSDNPVQVHRQVEDMISRGIQGAIIDWFGPNVPILSNASILMQREAEAHPGFEFAIMEDSGALFNAAVRNGCDVTSQLISDLHFINSQFVPSPAYMHLNGRPVIFFFGVTQFFIDWQRVLASLPSGELLLFRGQEGLQRSFAGGAFQWVDINSGDAFNQQLAAVDGFYTAAQAAGRPATGAAYKGFDDTFAEFGTNRQIHHQCGQTWIATFHETAKFFSAGHQLATLQIVTWNDYEEGTEIESGIDGCTFVTPSLSGTTLHWTVGGGTENTVDHFSVFASTDGQNLAKLADVPAGRHSIDLRRFNLPSPVSLLVKAVGQPSIRNTMSAPVVMKAGDAAPHAALNVSLIGNLTVHASTAGSSDPAGSIARTTIDFGDGTRVQSATATHTYARAGRFIVTATVVDNVGASGVAVTRVEAKATAPGPTFLSPLNSAIVNFTVNSPTPLVVSANSSNPIRRLNVLIDGKPAHADDRGVINSAFKVFVGTHHITAQATDSSGATSQASVEVTGEPGDLRPTAAVTVVPLRNVSPTTVLACSVTSHDPDGFILQHRIQFSDGAVFFTPAAVHTLATPGTFSVTANVIDQFGAPASQTVNFTVGPAGTAPSAAAQSEEQMHQAAHPQPEPIRRP